MKLRTLFGLNSYVFLIFGLAALVAPTPLASLYGAKLNQYGVYSTQFLGGTFLGYAVLAWFGRNAEESQVRHAIILALFVTWSTGFVLALKGQLFGHFNDLGWVHVVVSFLFAFGYGYFQIKT